MAKVTAIKEHQRGRIVYWEGTVPIFDDYPFYDITLLLDHKQHVVRYESPTGYYPGAWKLGAAIGARVERHRIYLLNGNEEVSTDIVDSRSEECVPASAPPTVVTIGPQVPC